MSGATRPFPASCLDPSEADALPVEQARQRILDALAPTGTAARVPLRDALDRVLAADVCAPHDVPSSTNSAMDGYAVRSADVAEAGVELNLAGRALAGHPYGGSVEPGTCVQIMTGAPLPSGADAVVMQEQTERRGDTVRVLAAARPGQNVRHAGEDLARGQVALSAGTRLRPAELGVLASLGCAEVSVHRPVRVAFFSTGDELRSLGEPLGRGEIYDSNRYTLFGMLRRLGAEVLDMGVVRDRPEALREAFTSAAEMADAVITSGGVSVGEADFVRRILGDLGQVGFWKIAMKPGRPFAFGRLGRAAFFGLPGNPVAVMVTFYQFVQPALLRLAGVRAVEPLTVPAVAIDRLRKKPGRTEFVRGVLRREADGRLAVRSAGQQGSGILSSMSRADCFVVLPHDGGTVEPGDVVTVQPFAGWV